MPIQQREHAQVFRTACGLLGLDHIGEVGEDDLHVSDTQAMGVDRKLTTAVRSGFVTSHTYCRQLPPADSTAAWVGARSLRARSMTHTSNPAAASSTAVARN
jgi:hypothetical protein